MFETDQQYRCADFDCYFFVTQIVCGFDITVISDIFQRIISQMRQSKTFVFVSFQGCDFPDDTAECYDDVCSIVDS